MPEQNSILQSLKTFMQEQVLNNSIDLHIDRTEPEPVNYSISTSGLILQKEDIWGNQTWQFNALLQSREYTADDLCRINASAFTESLVFCLQDCNSTGTLPNLPDGCTATKIYADNGLLLSVDDDGDRGIYQIQIHLIFEREDI